MPKKATKKKAIKKKVAKKITKKKAVKKKAEIKVSLPKRLSKKVIEPFKGPSTLASIEKKEFDKCQMEASKLGLSINRKGMAYELKYQKEVVSVNDVLFLKYLIEGFKLAKP